MFSIDFVSLFRPVQGFYALMYAYIKKVNLYEKDEKSRYEKPLKFVSKTLLRNSSEIRFNVKILFHQNRLALKWILSNICLHITLVN